MDSVSDSRSSGITRRDFLKVLGLSAAGAGLGGLLSPVGASSSERKPSLEQQIYLMRDYRYKRYYSSLLKYSFLMAAAGQPVEGYEKVDEEAVIASIMEANNAYKILGSAELPIPIGFDDNQRLFETVHADFLDNGYVYFFWNHPLIGDLSDGQKQTTQKENPNIIRTKILDGLHNTINEYIGKSLRREEVPEYDSKYPYFLSRAQITRDNTIITFDDFLVHLAGLSDKLAFWNHNARIYGNRSVVEDYVQGVVDECICNKPDKEMRTGQRLKQMMFRQWQNNLSLGSMTKEGLVREGIRQVERLYILYHEPVLIEGGTETDAYVNRLDCKDKNGIPNMKTFFDMYLFSINPSHPLHLSALEFKERMGIDNFDNVLTEYELN